MPDDTRNTTQRCYHGHKKVACRRSRTENMFRHCGSGWWRLIYSPMAQEKSICPQTCEIRSSTSSPASYLLRLRSLIPLSPKSTSSWRSQCWCRFSTAYTRKVPTQRQQLPARWVHTTLPTTAYQPRRGPTTACIPDDRDMGAARRHHKQRWNLTHIRTHHPRDTDNLPRYL